VVAFGRTSQPIEEEPYHSSAEKENVYNPADYQQYSIEEPATIEKHKNFGKVPHYIEKIKTEMKVTQEKRDEARAKAKMPPGTRLMTEDERIQTLEELHRQKLSISDMLFSLPLSLKTDALKNRKRELESKLLEIERAATTFSRKVVYIKEDVTLDAHTVPVEISFQARPLTAARSRADPKKIVPAIRKLL
jgi:Calmodulin-binding